MYKKVPQESWFDKGLHRAQEGLKLYGTVRGLYEAGTAVASGFVSIT